MKHCPVKWGTCIKLATVERKSSVIRVTKHLGVMCCLSGYTSHYSHPIPQFHEVPLKAVILHLNTQLFVLGSKAHQVAQEDTICNGSEVSAFINEYYSLNTLKSLLRLPLCKAAFPDLRTLGDDSNQSHRQSLVARVWQPLYLKPSQLWKSL